MSTPQTYNKQGTPTETAWTPNSSNNDVNTTSKKQIDKIADTQTDTTRGSATTPRRTSPIKGKLKPNSKRILDIIATQETRNASAAYKQVHPNASDITARVNAYKLLKSPSSQVYLQQHTAQAVNNILELANTAKSELVRLNANQDILDRNFGKATIKQEVNTTGVTLNINLTGE